MGSAHLVYQPFVLGSQYRAGALGNASNDGERVEHHLHACVDERHKRGLGFYGSRHHDVVGEFNFQLSVAAVPAL